MDGHCSGAIIHIARDGEGEYIEIDYKDPFPFDTIEPDEEVFLVDYSLQKEGDFDRLYEITKNIVWIYDHATAIKKHRKYDKLLLGIRRDGTAACELCWEYFFPEDKTPLAVSLLGDYDVWAFGLAGTVEFQERIKLVDTFPGSPVWEELFDPLNGNEAVNSAIDAGRSAVLYRDSLYKDIVRLWSFYTTLKGFKVIACNSPIRNSTLFQSIDSSLFDIMSAFVFDGTQWTVSLYALRDDIDVSEIATYFGGGGHKKAAGFQCSSLPFGT
jgi:oligoribonuclease NrnB/cAMP/cGMP phosphodiesterase (DHH superfamily)